MNKMVYKYKINGVHWLTQFQVPTGSKILKVGEQQGTIQVWVELPRSHFDVLEPLVEPAEVLFTFLCVHTGQPFPPLAAGIRREYVDTVMLLDGAEVVHVYKLTGI